MKGVKAMHDYVVRVGSQTEILATEFEMKNNACSQIIDSCVSRALRSLAALATNEVSTAPLIPLSPSPAGAGEIRNEN